MLNDNIIRYRSLLGFTRKEFSAISGISISFLQSIETGESMLAAEKLLDVTKRLRLSLDYLIGDDSSRTGKILTIVVLMEYLSMTNDREVNRALGNIFTLASENG